MRRPTTPAARLKKTALADALRIGLVEEIQNLLGAEAIEDLDFEALETAVRDRSMQIAARALEQRFNRDTSDAVSGAQHPCACGQMARYVDRRSKCFQTILGELTLERAYYHCAACQSGFCPRDRALGLDGSLSPGVIRMIGVVGAAVSFEEGSGLLKELAGLQVVAKLRRSNARLNRWAPKWPAPNRCRSPRVKSRRRQAIPAIPARSCTTAPISPALFNKRRSSTLERRRRSRPA